MKKYIGVIEVSAEKMTGHVYIAQAGGQSSVSIEDTLKTGYRVGFNGQMTFMLEADFEHLFMEMNEEAGNDFFTKANAATLTGAAKMMRVERRRYDLVKALAGPAQRRHDYLSQSRIPAIMESAEIESCTVAGVGRVALSSDIRCSVPKDNKEALEDWLRENGQEALISPSVNSSTLKAFVKEMIKGKKPWPADLLKVDPFTRAAITKV